MRELLFIRHFVRPTGGNITVRDFFFHALAHPGFETRIYFTPQSRHRASGLWSALRPDHQVPRPDWRGVDLVVVNGKDWRWLPQECPFHVLHLVQHLGYPTDPRLLGYLRRRAFRICVSEEIRESIADHAVGPSWVVPNAVDLELFKTESRPPPRSVLIWGGKDPALARAISRRLAAPGLEVEVALEWRPHREWAAALGRCAIFVALPHRREGFFRPPLEAMASGCAVVCSDAVGTRGHCLPEVTCLQPPWGDAAAHVAAARRLLAEEPLRLRLRREGRKLAARFGLDRQRRHLHRVLDDIFTRLAGQPPRPPPGRRAQAV